MLEFNVVEGNYRVTETMMSGLETRVLRFDYKPDLSEKRCLGEPWTPTVRAGREWFMKHHRPKFEAKGEWMGDPEGINYYSVWDPQCGCHLHSGRNSGTKLEALEQALSWLCDEDVSSPSSWETKGLLDRLAGFECEVVAHDEEIED